MSTIDDILNCRKNEWKESWKELAHVSGDILDVKLSPEQFVSMMILLKLIRYKNSNFKSEDCLIDIIGYAKLLLPKQNSTEQ